jgi:hypothetical protein
MAAPVSRAAVEGSGLGKVVGIGRSSDMSSAPAGRRLESGGEDG